MVRVCVCAGGWGGVMAPYSHPKTVDVKQLNVVACELILTCDATNFLSPQTQTTTVIPPITYHQRQNQTTRGIMTLSFLITVRQ